MGKWFQPIYPEAGPGRINAAAVQQQFPPIHVFRLPWFNDYTFTVPEHQVTHPYTINAQQILRQLDRRRGTVQYAPRPKASNPQRMLFGKQVTRR